MKLGRTSLLVCITCMLLASAGNAAREDAPAVQQKSNPPETSNAPAPAPTPDTPLQAKDVKPRPPIFSYDVTVDAATGWHVVTLSVEHPDEVRKNITAKISPEGGGELFSLKVGGIEFLHQPDSLSQLTRASSGIPIMYPTPNRVRDQKYVLNERQYTMLFPGETRRLHGLVKDDNSWKFDDPVVTRDGVFLQTRYEMDANNPRFHAFPFPSTLMMEFKLSADRMSVTYKVLNRGGMQMAFGFGLHPFWKVLGGRENIRVQANLPWRMEATEDLLPTGELIPVRGTTYDLLEPRPLTDIMGFDDVFYGATPSSRIRIYYDALHIRLELKTTQDFSHVVVYTPDREYFCVEDQTCSTDAFNLYAKGMGQRSGLRTLNPGVSAGGTIEYVFEYQN